MCDCVKKFDEQLRPHGCRISINLALPKASDNPQKIRGLISIETERLSDAPKRKKSPTVLASFCPFCGTKWED